MKLTEDQKNRLYKLLKQDKQDKVDNRLDFMRWDLYREQNDMREAILDRIRTKEGPTIFVVFGGNRSGKSELGGGIVAEIFKSMPNMRIWCATLSDISVKVQQRKLKEMIRKKDITYGEYNQVRGWKNKTIIGENKTVAYFKTYEQGTEAFQGDDIDVAWFDEESPYDVFSETAIRLSDRSGIFVLTFTSLMGFTRLVNRLYNSADENIKTTILTPFMNPFLSDQAKKQLESMIDPDERESRWHGKPHLKEGLVYKNFRDIHIIEDFDHYDLHLQFPRRYVYHEGIDPHTRTPHHWLRFLYDNQKDILYVVDEIKAPIESMIVRDFCMLIKQVRSIYSNDKTQRISIVPEFCQIDTSSMQADVISVHKEEDQEDVHTMRMEFYKNGINTILCSKDNALGIGAVKERLKIVKTLSGEVKRMPKLYVTKSCKGVAWEFQRYAWDKYASSKIAERKDMINKPLKKDDHFMDIIKYECIKLKTDFKHMDDPTPEYEPKFGSMGY